MRVYEFHENFCALQKSVKEIFLSEWNLVWEQVRASWKSAQSQFCFTSRRKWFPNRFPHLLTYLDEIRRGIPSSNADEGLRVSWKFLRFTEERKRDVLCRIFVKFDMGASASFMKIGTVAVLLYLKAKMNFSPFSTFIDVFRRDSARNIFK